MDFGGEQKNAGLGELMKRMKKKTFVPHSWMSTLEFWSQCLRKWLAFCEQTNYITICG